MSASQRRKGNQAEVDLVNWLRANGWPDARRYLSGDGRQPGDIDGIPGVCLEVKNHARHDISGWLRQARAEADIALPVVIIKPRGVSDPGKWWAVLRVDDAMDLLGPESPGVPPDWEELPLPFPP